MTPVQHPSREKLQEWLKQRHQAKEPPPSPEEIRRQLGWGLLNNKRTECAR